MSTKKSTKKKEMKSSTLVMKYCQIFRGQPALTLLENLRRSFMKRFYKRHEKAKKWRTETPPGVWGKLTENQDHGRFVQVMCASDAEYEMKERKKYYIVRLDLKTCDCRSWKISGIPCKYVMAVITATRRQRHEFVHNYLSKEAYLRTYSNIIHPIPHQSNWPEMTFNKVLPPDRKTKEKQKKRPKLGSQK
ncbi:hypothetical protein ACOSP7_003386 [Xanthoceras sorbifolium]